jgi:hypothetical protein
LGGKLDTVGIGQTVVNGTVTSLRAFDEFCANAMKHEDDIVAGCFPGLSIQRFLNSATRDEVNKRVPHITLTAFSDFKGFHYKHYLGLALPQAVKFCEYATVQAQCSPRLAKFVELTLVSCAVVQRDYLNQCET